MRKPEREGSDIGSDGLPVRLSGEWIRRKHHFLDRYCAITAVGMKNKFRERIFLDVMAGPGMCKVRESGDELPGSPLIAIKHPFTKFTFLESNATLASALEKRISAQSNTKLARVIARDWTEAVSQGQLSFNGLVVAFIADRRRYGNNEKRINGRLTNMPESGQNLAEACQIESFPPDFPLVLPENRLSRDCGKISKSETYKDGVKTDKDQYVKFRDKAALQSRSVRPVL
jgi:hypothetical protein